MENKSLFAIVVTILAASAYAQLDWGVTGHAMVADIAQHFLSSKGENNVAFLLSANNGSMSAVSSWADQVAREKGYEWSKPLHYINTPDRKCNYDHSRDCKNEAGTPEYCVAGAIANYTNRLSLSLPFDQLNEALKFLIHFVGDVHQPLHVGFTTDRGGNEYHGEFEGKSTNLHSIWDSDIIGDRLKTTFKGQYSQYLTYMFQNLQTIWNSSIPQWQKCSKSTSFNACADQWAEDSIVVACQYSYVDVDGKTWITNGFNLGSSYYNRNYPIIEVQIAKAGIRLANIINSLYSMSEIDGGDEDDDIDFIYKRIDHFLSSVA